MQKINKPINVANAIFDEVLNFLLFIINLFLNKILVDIALMPNINELSKVNIKILFKLLM